jgi:putative peptidoglycan lipid II flippase
MATDSTKPKLKKSPAAHASVGRSAFLVSAGIFLSRISGLVRDRIFAHYFGNSWVADAFRAGLRIPNFLQMLFGEGVLSASFIPVYARLLADGDEEEAGKIAGAVFSLLALVTAVLVLVGVLATPYFIDVIAPGFHDERRALTIRIVRILFPGVGMLVLSAWCLGILNSHRKFFLSYVSGVAWNAFMITTMLVFGPHADETKLSIYLAWGSVAGMAAQFLVQVPVVLRLAPRLRLAIQLANENLRTVIRSFFPVQLSRGVSQISGYIDQIICSYLPSGSVSALFNAQTIALLPVSLFGMAISAAELPAMSSATGNPEDIAVMLRKRLLASTQRIGFFVVPSAIAFLVLGDVVAGAIYQTGRFGRADTRFVWAILAGSAVGLVASTVSRLYSSAYFALRDTRTPLRYAIVRVALTSLLGYLFALPLPRLLGIDHKWGAAGLTISAGMAAWLENLLLRRGMGRKIGAVEFPAAYLAKLWTCAVIAAAAAWGIKWLLHIRDPRIAGVVVLVPYGLIYLGSTALMGIQETTALMKRVLRSR